MSLEFGIASGESRRMLKATDLRKSFGPLEVLKGISLEVAPHEVVSIVGASGSGKSTLLRCINVMETPSSGVLEFENIRIDFGNEAVDPRRAKILQELRASIGMVFQNYNLWPHMSVIDNVIEAPIGVRNIPRKEAVAYAEHLLERVGMAEKRDAFPNRLSGGQQQRVAFARALAMRPKVLLLDEVTAALDPELVGEVLQVMKQLAEDGMTMLVVTHEIEFAREVSTRTLFVDKGVIAESGPSRKVLTDPDNDRTRQFLKRVLHKI